MNRNVKIAKELVKLAKSLVADETLEKFYSMRTVNDVSIGFVEFKLAIVSDENKQNSQAIKILDSVIDDIAKTADIAGLRNEDIECDKNAWYSKERKQYEDYVRFTLNHGGNNVNHYNQAHNDLVDKVVKQTKNILRKEGFVFKQNA